MSGWLKATAASVALVAGMASGGAGAFAAASSSAAPPGDQAPVCGTPAAGHARCGAIQLLDPAQNWHPGPRTGAPSKKPVGGSSAAVPSGYYPADLQSAYHLTSALSRMTTPGGATIAVVDAYDDPYAASDLATYRSTMSVDTDPGTGLAPSAIPPLCTTGTSGCVKFTKVNQSGGTSYPAGNTGWGEEISLDLDMISAICPECNITLVEASSNSFANLDTAVAYAKSLHPAAVTNSYGGSEFSSETSDNGTYSYSSTGGPTAVTAATGDGGYGVEFPAASPDLTAVGGTTLTHSGSGSSLAWNPQTVWSGAGAGCSADETMPTWQDSSAFDLGSVCTTRQVGDVSAVADPNTGVAVYDSYGESGWMVFGGTSASTQIVGAMYGLAAGAGHENPSPQGLYGGSGVVAVTSGSDGSCGGTYLCQAGTGQLSSDYAGPVGVGVPDGIGAFSAATAGTLSFSPSSETATAGQATGALTVDLSATAPPAGVTVDLAASSSHGGFSTSSSGPFTTTLALTVPNGGTATGSFYYEDTAAGTPTLIASATGWATGSLSVTVAPGSLASMAVSPTSATVAEGGTQTFTATGADSYGNPVTVDPSWTTSGSVGFLTSSGSSATFTAGQSSGTGIVTATQSGFSASASVTVSALAAMRVGVTNGLTVSKGPNYRTPITVTATDATTNAPLGGANVALDVYSGSTCSGTVVSSGSGTTGSNGQVAFTFTTKTQGSHCALATVSDSGYSTGSGQDSFTN